MIGRECREEEPGGGARGWEGLDRDEARTRRAIHVRTAGDACATAARWESRERRREDRGRAGPRGRGKEGIRETGIWDREGIAPRKSDPNPEIAES